MNGAKFSQFSLIVVISTLALATLSGCTNMFGNSAPRGRKAGVNTVSPSSGSGVFALNLETVVVNNRSNRTFDLLGDGSGMIGNLCQVPVTTEEEGETTTSTENTCTCHFEYIKTDGTTESYDVPSFDVEPNLLKCNFNNIASVAPYVNVRIHHTTSDSYSNTVKFSFAGTGQFLDLTDPRSYLQPFRYQCKDAVFMAFQFGLMQGAGEVYDPILSEDPSIAFAWNFYAGNMYNASVAYVENNEPQNGLGSICPATPNDPSFGTDLSLYSLANDTSGSNRIYPPIGSAFDRSTFFLARQATGVFNIPVNAYVAPNTISSVPGNSEDSPQSAATPPPVGYGAAPTPLDNGTEVCPDTSVQIPAGFRWVKLWQFRASLAPRNAPTSDALGRTAIACNPGMYIDPMPGPTSAPTLVNPSCENGLTANTDDSVLANRLIYGRPTASAGNPQAACVQLTHPNPATLATVCNDPVIGPGSGAGCTANSIGVQKAAYWAWPRASDVWLQQANPTNGGLNSLCSSGGAADTLKLCQTAPTMVPFDDDVRLAPLEEQNVSRYDFVMVVSPQSIHLRDMNDASSSVVLPYIPYRFYPGKCVGTPSAPAFAGDCAVSNRINYSLKAHDVNVNGDAPPSTSGTDNGRLPVFPVCALQPI